jgi:hypothetical protein
MSKHLKTATVAIPVDRLTIGTIIYAKGGDFWTGEFAEVVSIEDQPDDESFAVTCQIDGVGFESLLTVPYGGTVQFGGVGEPVLRPLTFAEAHAAQIEAMASLDETNVRVIAQVDASIASLQSVDDRLIKAVADAVGVPMQMAAE